MSWQMTERVIKYSRAKGAARNVLHAIAYHAHDDGSGAYPSIATLAREANVSRRDVFRSLRRLRDLGEITINLRGDGRAHGTPNQYTMTLAASIGDTTSPIDGEIRQNRGDTTSPIDVEIVTSQVTRCHANRPLTRPRAFKEPSPLKRLRKRSEKVRPRNGVRGPRHHRASREPPRARSRWWARRRATWTT